MPPSAGANRVGSADDGRPCAVSSLAGAPAVGYLAGMWKLAFIALWCLAGSASAAIYKSVDAEGNVVYSDEPRPNSKPIDLPPPSVYTPPPLPKVRPAPLPPSAKSAEQRRPADGYTSFTVEHPKPQDTIWSRDIDVVLQLEPALEPGDRIEVRLNGTVIPDIQTTRFALHDLDRGTYHLSAAVLDRNGRRAISTGDVEFYIKQHSVLLP